MRPRPPPRVVDEHRAHHARPDGQEVAPVTEALAGPLESAPGLVDQRGRLQRVTRQRALREAVVLVVGHAEQALALLQLCS